MTENRQREIRRLLGDALDEGPDAVIALLDATASEAATLAPSTFELWRARELRRQPAGTWHLVESMRAMDSDADIVEVMVAAEKREECVVVAVDVEDAELKVINSNVLGDGRVPLAKPLWGHIQRLGYKSYAAYFKQAVPDRLPVLDELIRARRFSSTTST